MNFLLFFLFTDFLFLLFRDTISCFLAYDDKASPVWPVVWLLAVVAGTHDDWHRVLTFLHRVDGWACL